MADCLCFMVRFLQPLSHGRGEDGEPEWPPSPLRFFQALVAGAAGRWNERTRLQHALPALEWLERQSPPRIIAPSAEPSGAKYRLYVPDNVGDRVAASWTRGGPAELSEFRTEKDVRAMKLHGDCVHFVYRLADSDRECARHRKTLLAAAESITHLGWGIDTVTASATVLADTETEHLPGEQWHPAAQAATRRRVPTAGAVHALIARHEAFLNRLGLEGFKPVPPLSTFQLVGYRRGTDAASRSFISFSIMKPDGDGFRPFDPARHSRTVAGMMRGAAKMVAEDAGGEWTPAKIGTFVLGHGEARDEQHKPVGPKRFAFLPLPSIERRGPGKPQVIGSIRRVLVTTFTEGCEREIAWARRALANQPLVDEETKKEVALLTSLPASDWTVQQYTQPGSCWATVTPVVLPGYDDPDHLRRRAQQKTLTADQQRHMLGRLAKRVDGLLRKAIVQTGFSAELAQHAELEWRSTGFLPGTEPATRYGVPDYLKRFPRLHVRIEWRDSAGNPVQVPGPICIGGGRYFGLGLFAPVLKTNE